MKRVIKSIIVILLATLAITGCANNPEQPENLENSADEQRLKARQAQDELSSETRGK